MFSPRLRSSSALVIALALGACTAPGLDASGSSPDASGDPEIAARKRPPPPPDAATTSDACAGGDPSSPGIISCYTEGSPTATCTLPVQCCFGNYSSQHDGYCSTSACSWGTITCDGPEDCATGEHCCAHVLVDPEYGITGYKLACQATACGAAPANQELCHPTSSLAGTCSTGTACVTTFGNDSDLPPSLYICQ